MRHTLLLLLLLLLLTVAYSTVFINTTNVLAMVISTINCFVSEEVVDVVLKQSLSARDAQNLCMFVTVVCVKFLLLFSYGQTQLNVVIKHIFKLCCAWVFVLCGVLSVLFLGARVPSVEALLVWCCCGVGLMLVKFTEHMCLFHSRALVWTPPLIAS